jgi:hypothetical protein
MLSVPATTLAGAAAMLKYAGEHVDAGHLWPDGISDDETSGDWDWLYFLSRNLAASLRRLEP